jgi:hypothetical protein
VIVATVFGSSMTAGAALADNGVIPNGGTLINPEDPYEDYIPVSYIVEEGGYITGGEEEQLVLPGGDADPVIAVAEEGWIFIGWDDDSTDPSRHDKNITEPMEFIAIFEMIEDEEGGSSANGPGNEPQEGDKAEDQPSEEGGQSQKGESGENGEQGDQEESDGENDGNQDSDDRGEGSGNNNEQGNGAGGKWEESNMIYDGKTYYKDTLEYYYEYAQQIFEEYGEIPPELREFFELYYDSI